MKKILIVDDSSFARLQIKNIFLENGYDNIIEASNGNEAVAMYKKHKPDFVTMDILMPECDGICAIGEIKLFDSSAKIVVCSDLAQNNMVIQSIRAGAKNFITKPISKTSLMKTMKKILSEGSSLGKLDESIKEMIEQKMSLDINCVGDKESSFSIALPNNALIDEGFFRDDLLIVNKTIKPENGDLAVATHENNFIVGYAYNLTSGKILMEFANKDYSPVKIEGDKILGVVVTCIRRVKNKIPKSS